jgi:hypothetical protein
MMERRLGADSQSEDDAFEAAGEPAPKRHHMSVTLPEDTPLSR